MPFYLKEIKNKNIVPQCVSCILMINGHQQYVGLFYSEENFIFLVVPPNIMGEEQNVSVLISQAVELICQSDAVPPPTLLWLKDGRPLLKKPGLSISEDGSVLKVRLQICLRFPSTWFHSYICKCADLLQMVQCHRIKLQELLISLHFMLIQFKYLVIYPCFSQKLSQKHTFRKLLEKYSKEFLTYSISQQQPTLGALDKVVKIRTHLIH